MGSANGSYWSCHPDSISVQALPQVQQVDCGKHTTTVHTYTCIYNMYERIACSMHQYYKYMYITRGWGNCYIIILKNEEEGGYMNGWVGYQSDIIII